MKSLIAFREELKTRIGRQASIDPHLNSIIEAALHFFEQNFDLPYLSRHEVASVPVPETIDPDNPIISVTIPNAVNIKTLKEVFVRNTPEQEWLPCRRETVDRNKRPLLGLHGFDADTTIGQYSGYGDPLAYWQDTSINRQLRLVFNFQFTNRQSQIMVIWDQYSELNLPNISETQEGSAADIDHPLLEIGKQVWMYRCVLDAATILRDDDLQARNIPLYDSALKALDRDLNNNADPGFNIGEATYGAHPDVRHGLGTGPVQQEGFFLGGHVVTQDGRFNRNV